MTGSPVSSLESAGAFGRSKKHPTLSLIIPCGPQEIELPRLIRSDRPLSARWERLLAVGPDQHFTLPFGWNTLRSDFGRGRQLNHAAEKASGDWIWFIHADSLPDKRAIQGVAEFIDHPPQEKQGDRKNRRLGYCKLSFDPDGPSLTRLNGIGANLRSRWLQLPYGDQGMCIRKRDFNALGGFREDLQRGEDLDFVVRAKTAGMLIQCLGGCMATSARRYRQNGWLKTTLGHQVAALRLIRNARRSASS